MVYYLVSPGALNEENSSVTVPLALVLRSVPYQSIPSDYREVTRDYIAYLDTTYN